MKNMKMPGLLRRSILLLALLLFPVALSGSALADSGQLPGAGITVKPIYSGGGDNDLFQLLIVNRGLERLGYKVAEPLRATIQLMIVAVGQGDADYNVEFDDPLHNVFYNAAGGDSTMEKVGVIASPELQGYLIDKATADKYHITNLGQFKDVNISKLFSTKGDSMADLTGCKPGWGCERVIEHQLDALAFG